MSIFSEEYDVVVVGGGLAGAHAAKEAAAGQKTLLLTSSWDTAARPAWGPMIAAGPLKSGKKRRRNDPLKAINNNAMGRATINGQELVNLDCFKYQGHWKYVLERAKRLVVFQDTAEKITPAPAGWRVETRWGGQFRARRVVIAVGTFLGGTVRVGVQESAGGRPGEVGARALEQSLCELGVDLEVAVATAPPTISASSIDRARLEGEASDTGGPYQIKLADGRIMIPAVFDSAGRELYLYVAGLDAPITDLGTLRGVPGMEKIETISQGYEVAYLKLAPGQLEADGECRRIPGLFFAGRVAGARDYWESIQTGLAAGAARRKFHVKH